MKKLFILCTAFFVFTCTSYSQLRIALTGGGHTASVNETNDLPNWSELESKYSSRTGAHFGFLADLQLGMNSKFWFQPGIVYYNKGRKFSSTYDTSVYNYFSIDAQQYINYIDVPLNLLYKIPFGEKNKFFIGGGPYLSFLYNGNERTETFMKSGTVVTEENDDLPVGDGPGKYKTLDFGVNGIAGLEFGKVFLAFNYSRGLNDFYTANYNGSFRHQVIGGSLGVFLGKPVPLEPKFRDKDGDGIADAEDLCPEEPGTLITNGCPDDDADGIANNIDKCPQVKGTVKYNGCPVPDSDNDGVNDDEDRCKDVPGPKNNNGCPVENPDSDKDGIPDADDECKDVPGLARYNGCPIPDADGDGINDEMDKCPTIKGAKENNGCAAEIAKEIVEKVEFAAKRIQFAFMNAELLPESLPVLDEVVDILKQNSGLKLEIEGHTSNMGDFNANMKLSNERAQEVKNYLVSKGIDASRLNAVGYGPTRPISDSKSAEEQAKNRRVELKLMND